ncbi:MAG: Nif3-like dinuclear metal center hexameric protein [Actinomycetota bacterium]|nr:Nif3-like dinuclear metal center hexameric protein [Actinomycetota bacterium]MDQ2956160.1 Nif3-like dinuclear metal center hexameric protein [Actinomycetota bacterium]
MPSLAELIDVLDRWYPPATAESWDAVGLTCGDPAAELDRILLAVDCVPATVAEAIDRRAGLLLTHHPLLLTGVHGVPADDPKGALVHRMIKADLAHFVAHTNADIAAHGVSEALADLLGLLDCQPLQAASAAALDHLTVFVPPAHTARLLAALAEAGAGAVGNYAECSFTVDGTGSFRPLPGAQPAEGAVGELSRNPETRLSMVLPRARRAAVLAAMRASHPYEEVAFELTEQPRLAGSTGTGRVGRLAVPLTLRDFLDHAAASLPRTAWGIRAAGDPAQLIGTVAVCGGSGASYAEAARRAGADAYLTSDLKHHSTSEAVDEAQGVGLAPLALIDAAHWATEAPWLQVAAELLREHFGDRLEVVVSALVTDPWTLHAR